MSSASRDNWERLVAAVFKRQQYLQLCDKPYSRSPSISTTSSNRTSDFSEEFLSQELGFLFVSPFPQLPPAKLPLSQVGNNTSRTIKRRLFFPWYQRRKSNLPEESSSEIPRRTSLADASRFAVISNRLEPADDSDNVWDRFLPSDLPEIMSRSVSPVVYTNKKELYSSLCHSPILIDAGKLSFSLEKKSGKKCYMVGAKELGIIWCGDTPWYWDLTSHPDSRFSEVALLKSVCWLEIRGTINTQMLSSNTIYGAYLVFKLDREPYGLELANAFVRFKNDQVEGGDERKAILDHFGKENARDRHGRTGEVPVRIGNGLTEIAAVHLQRSSIFQQQRGRVGVGRSDGWMEVELGSFFNDRGHDGAVESWLLGRDGYEWKSGLIVQGIEFRPKP